MQAQNLVYAINILWSDNTFGNSTGKTLHCFRSCVQSAKGLKQYFNRSHLNTSNISVITKSKRCISFIQTSDTWLNDSSSWTEISERICLLNYRTQFTNFVIYFETPRGIYRIIRKFCVIAFTKFYLVPDIIHDWWSALDLLTQAGLVIVIYGSICQ